MGKGNKWGRANKGSQFWLQNIVNDCPDYFNDIIKSYIPTLSGLDIIWKSPLASEGYKEYQDAEFLKVLGLKGDIVDELLDFWPQGGPHWDGLAKAGEDTYLLIEAKSHIKELVSSPCGAIDQDSKEKIIKQLTSLKTNLHASKEIDFYNHFYQYGNRLAHLDFLRQRNIDTFLVYICFVDDTTIKDISRPATREQWEGALELIEAFLGLKGNRLMPYIKHIFVDISDLGTRIITP